MGFDISYKLENGATLSPSVALFGNFMEVTLTFSNAVGQRRFKVYGKDLFEFGFYVLFKSKYLGGDPKPYFISNLNSVSSFLDKNDLHELKPHWFLQDQPLILQSFEGEIIKFHFSKSFDFIELEFDSNIEESTHYLTLDPFDYFKILKKFLYLTDFGSKNAEYEKWIKMNLTSDAKVPAPGDAE